MLDLALESISSTPLTTLTLVFVFLNVTSTTLDLLEK